MRPLFAPGMACAGRRTRCCDDWRALRWVYRWALRRLLLPGPGRRAGAGHALGGPCCSQGAPGGARCLANLASAAPAELWNLPR